MLGALDHTEIERLLTQQKIGRLGCHSNGRTYIVPITYVYEAPYIYGHASRGMKIEMMRTNPEVCFEVEQIEGMGRWQTVIAWGTYEELRDENAGYAMELLASRLKASAPSETSRPSHGMDVEKTHSHKANGHSVIYRIRLHKKTGRFETHAKD